MDIQRKDSLPERIRIQRALNEPHRFQKVFQFIPMLLPHHQIDILHRAKRNVMVNRVQERGSFENDNL